MRGTVFFFLLHTWELQSEYTRENLTRDESGVISFFSVSEALKLDFLGNDVLADIINLPINTNHPYLSLFINFVKS